MTARSMIVLISMMGGRWTWRGGSHLVSAAWLAVDPTWAPLRGHPGFERLVPRR
jgi:hypothetical protein